MEKPISLKAGKISDEKDLGDWALGIEMLWFAWSEQHDILKLGWVISGLEQQVMG